jgi:transcriptional regulator with XRE-family HTH domain
VSATSVIIDGVTYRPAAPPDVGFHSFAQLMRAHRKSAGWTLDEACEKIGCSKSYLHGMESGANEPSLRMAYQITLAYDVALRRLAVALDVKADTAAPAGDESGGRES